LLGLPFSVLERLSKTNEFRWPFSHPVKKNCSIFPWLELWLPFPALEHLFKQINFIDLFHTL
jgi:hypothetical protein